MMALDFTQFAVAGSLAMMQRPGKLQIDAPPDVPAVAIEQGAPAKPLSELVVNAYELVALRYGRKLRTFAKYTRINPAANTLTKLIDRDPRRIRLEIILAESAAATQIVFLGPLAQMQQGSSAQITLAVAAPNFLLVRDLSTDADAVTEDLWVQSNAATTVFSVRETLLTPLPVDEY